MANNQWLDWLKCNVLELVILILLLLLLVKVYSVPAVEEVPAISGGVTMEEPLTEEAAPEVLVEGAITWETQVEEAPAEAEEQPLGEETTPEPAAETPAE